MRYNVFLIIVLLFLASCNEKTRKADAYGSFEAREVVVSSETNGRILRFDITEGASIDKDDLIALIDTTLFHLQKEEINAGMQGIRVKLLSINAQNEILRQQADNLGVNMRRVANMLKDDAATVKQYDDLAGQAAVIEKQILANNTQKASVAAEIAVFESRKATLNEQIARSNVKSPRQGTILEKYAEAGEMAIAGKPLVKISDLSIMKLKVYVSGAQLPELRTGQEVTVRTDKGKKDYSYYRGVISHISGKAEFTPKIIQTKEERVAFVYSVTIEVENDGYLKSGMPGEAIF